MKNVLVALAILFSFLACNKDEPSQGNVVPSKGKEISAEVYDIYTALYITKSSMTYLVNVTDTFLNCADLSYFELDSIKITEDVINKSIATNYDKYLIEEGKIGVGGIVVVEKNTLEGDGWQNFLAEHGAYTKIGYPQIYDNGNRAIVETMSYCGPLCASWVMHYLEKRNGFWVPSGTYMIKVSK